MTTDTTYASEKSTEAFIDENPIEIVLRRSVRTKTSAGGWAMGAPSPLPPQRVRLVALHGYLADQRLGPEGDITVPRFMVVGLPTVDMKRDDTFEYDGETYRINRVNTTPPWAKRGEAFEHGSP
jgi:hypothetical protein